MKKLMILSSVVLLLGLASCNKSENTSGTPTSSPQDEKTDGSEAPPANSN
jgi:hypothetical protein